MEPEPLDAWFKRHILVHEEALVRYLSANAGNSPAPSGAAQAASGPTNPAARTSGAGEQLEHTAQRALFMGTNVQWSKMGMEDYVLKLENPKLSLTWAMSRDVKLRGSWGTSFRAPSLVDINPFVFSYKAEISSFPNFTGNPAIAGFSPVPGLTLSNVGLVIGDQPNLKPETRGSK